MPKDTIQNMSDHEVDTDVNVVDCADFDVDKLTLPPIDEKRSSDAYYHSFPSYKYDTKSDKVLIKTKPIKITRGGIPRLDDKWRKTDAKREFFWLGADPEQPACVELFDTIRSIDDKFNQLISYDPDEKRDANVESKTVVFQKEKKKTEPLTLLDYSPLIKLSIQGGDGEKKPDQPEYVPYERLKLRFAKKYDKDRQEGEPSELTTALFVGDKEEPEDIKYASDYEKFLRWNCTAEFVIQISKFRTKKAVEKDKKGKSLPRECAFDMTVLQVVITEEAPRLGMSNSDRYRKRMFTSKTTKPTETKSETKQVKKTKDESESSSESDSSDEEELPTYEQATSKKEKEKEKPAPSKKDTKSSKKVVSESSESESSSSDSESDSEDDSSSEEPPAPKPKGKTSKK